MRRYWLTIMLGLLAVSGISTYYFFGSKDHLPEFKLVTLQGEPHEGESLTLSGTYGGRKQSEFLEITKEGSRYNGRERNLRRGLISKVGWFYRDGILESFIGEHRNIARGKNYGPQALINEDEFIYAKWVDRRSASTDQGGTLQITVFDRGSGEEREFEADIPVHPGTIADVRRLGEELHIVMFKHLLLDTSAEIYDVVINLSTEQWARTDKLAEGKKMSGEVFNSNDIYRNEAFSEPLSEFILIREDKQAVVSGSIGGNFVSRELSRQFYAYSFLTGEKEALPAFYGSSNSFVSDSDYYMTSLYGNLFSLVQFNKKEAVVSQYNLSSKEERREYVTLTPEQFGASEIIDAIIKSNKIYLLLATTGAPVAAVVHLQGEKLLYLGQVTYETPEAAKTEKIEYLRLRSINIKGIRIWG
ncbi:hypothetical protein ACFOQM_15990 [Paenibacillus sp. GCM10012307]|uniref:Uncharacterized protein n=1 Tax=Paenibacillus roseus TaxID=2798579 RepID=A0A934J0T7_9BACL|nr:hypothetical protein [Paenibacillus roseus]MBJ6362746.1 hypothetical protein [Paenibacillus roseus]